MLKPNAPLAFAKFLDHGGWVPPLTIAFLGVVFVCTYLLSADGLIVRDFSTRQIFGATAMFTLFPGYLLAAMRAITKRTNAILEDVAPWVDASGLSLVRDKLYHVPKWIVLLIIAGAAYGAQQNGFWFSQLEEGTGFDFAFLAINCIVWMVVALLIGWRVPCSLALRELGRSAKVDLYHLERLKPIARIATFDVLSVMGALCLVPLQSLDANFRWANYGPALYVGVTTATVFFILPVVGLRASIRRAKGERLADLEAELATVPRSRTTELELTLAHIERVRSISDWPVDLKVLSRVFVYVVIPPIAWVAAALVENYIDRL